MKSCIKSSNLRDCRKQSFACMDGLQICRIVQWCQITAFHNFVYHLISNNHRIFEILSSMYCPMPDSIKLIKGSKYSRSRIQQRLYDKSKSSGMIIKRLSKCSLNISMSILQKRILRSDFFYDSFGYDSHSLHIKKLIFQRRTSCIDN